MKLAGRNIRDVCSPIIGDVVLPIEGRQDFSWSSYWETLISATIENAAPTDVVLTFPEAKTTLGADDFTIAEFTISSASWTEAVLTLALSESVIYFNGNLTITFVKTGQIATVTNNVADDGHTVGWYKIGDGSSTYMTKDGSNRVSQWNDLSGAGHHLKQATAGNQPLYQSTGILTQTDDYMVTDAFTYNQPSYIYAIIKQKSWESNNYLFCSRTNNTPGLIQYANSPKIAVFAGIPFLYSNAPLDEYFICRAFFNGASSNLWINETGLAGGTGNSNFDGFRIGGNDTHAEYYEIILRDSADDAATVTAIYDYLKKN